LSSGPVSTKVEEAIKLLSSGVDLNGFIEVDGDIAVTPLFRAVENGFMNEFALAFALLRSGAVLDEETKALAEDMVIDEEDEKIQDLLFKIIDWKAQGSDLPVIEVTASERTKQPLAVSGVVKQDVAARRSSLRSSVELRKSKAVASNPKKSPSSPTSSTTSSVTTTAPAATTTTSASPSQSASTAAAETQKSPAPPVTKSSSPSTFDGLPLLPIIGGVAAVALLGGVAYFFLAKRDEVKSS